MNDLERINKVINWLYYNDIAKNQKNLAEKLGYTESSLSQILTGQVKISDKFINKLISLDENINKLYITEGVGSVIIKENEDTKNEDGEIISTQSELIKIQQKLIEKLQEKINKSSASE